MPPRNRLKAEAGGFMFAPKARNRFYSLEHCGTHMVQLKDGGCGGGGAIYGCKMCQKVFIQLNGGLAPAPLLLEEMEGRTIANFTEKDKEDTEEKDKIEMA